MITKLIGFLLVATLFGGCQSKPFVEPLIVGPEPEPFRVVFDSIKSGSYLAIAINEDAATVYPKIQALRVPKGVTYLEVVSNIFSDITQIRERLPLYQYIVLDQKQGTNSGIQITIKDQTIKSIYLNSGRPLIKWPDAEGAKSSIQVGDNVSSLYGKLLNISLKSQYANKFERIGLFTKNLAAGYDSGMSQSPQWYFSYLTGPDQSDQVQVHFQGGRVSGIYIAHYTK